MSRPFAIAIIAYLLLFPLNAHAGSTGALRSSSGGTGISTSGGSGGTGISPHSASSGTTPQLTPAKPPNTHPAGVRPHTDLAAATKLIGLSSSNLIKHSALFPKLPAPTGDPSLIGPLLNKIGAAEGGSASFKAAVGIPNTLSNGRIYPTNGIGSSGGRAHPSLSAAAAHGVSDHPSTEAASPNSSAGRGLLSWLHGLITCACICAIGYWMWTAAPKGARMMAPAKSA